MNREREREELGVKEEEGEEEGCGGDVEEKRGA